MDDFEYNRPNTRARIAARRRRSNLPQDESAVLPGPRRTMAGWVGSGRIVSLPLLVLALSALAYVTAGPAFHIRDIRVEGADLLRPAAVVELSNARGRSIWLVDTALVAEAVRSNAYVERASAFITLPDRLTIVVRERRPELRWQSGGQLYLVDADGRVLGADATGVLSNTLVIDDRSGRPIQPNDLVDPDALALGRALTLRLPAELGIGAPRLAWATDTGVVAEIDGGRTVVFGRSDHLERKLAVLAELLRDSTAFQYLDLRPETPYYRNDQ